MDHACRDYDNGYIYDVELFLNLWNENRKSPLWSKIWVNWLRVGTQIRDINNVTYVSAQVNLYFIFGTDQSQTVDFTILISTWTAG